MRAVALTLGVLVTALPAGTEAGCAARDWIVQQLAEQYREQPVARAITAGGDLLEVLTSADGKTWTLLLTKPSGQSCSLIEGANWGAPKREVALTELPD